MGDHLMKSTSLKILRALSLVSATLEIECLTQHPDPLRIKDEWNRERPVRKIMVIPIIVIMMTYAWIQALLYCIIVCFPLRMK